MKRDIRKFSEWLEKTMRAGLADEKALQELKQAAAAKPVSDSKAT